MAPLFNLTILGSARKFVSELDKPVKNKIFNNIDKAKHSKDSGLFKKIDESIWEFRTRYNGLQYRLFAFWDKRDNNNTVVVCTHGIVKKTPKIPKEDITRAKEIMNKYFDNT